METIILSIHLIILIIVILSMIGYFFYYTYCWLLDREAKKFDEGAALTGLVLAISWEIWALIGLCIGFMHGSRYLIRKIRSRHGRQNSKTNNGNKG